MVVVPQPFISMEEWRQVATRMFPDLQPEVEAAVSPMGLWTEIIFNFDDAYLEPKNEDFIRRVYEYADWCVRQEGGEDARHHLPTCVCVCFLEHLSTCKAYRDDIPRWFSVEDIEANLYFFKYLLTEEEEAEFDQWLESLCQKTQSTQ